MYSNTLCLHHASTDGTLRMTQQEIAPHLGTTREVVARLLRKMAADKSIETKRGLVAIHAPKLANLLNRTGSCSTRRPDKTTGRKRKKATIE